MVSEEKGILKNINFQSVKFIDYFLVDIWFSIGYQTLMLCSAGLAAVFFGLIYVGAGRYTIAVKLEKK